MLKNSTTKNFETPLNDLMMKTAMMKEKKTRQSREMQKILVLPSRDPLFMPDQFNGKDGQICFLESAV